MLRPEQGALGDTPPSLAQAPPLGPAQLYKFPPPGPSWDRPSGKRPCTKPRPQTAPVPAQPPKVPPTRLGTTIYKTRPQGCPRPGLRPLGPAQLEKAPPPHRGRGLPGPAFYPAPPNSTRPRPHDRRGTAPRTRPFPPPAPRPRRPFQAGWHGTNSCATSTALATRGQPAPARAGERRRSRCCASPGARAPSLDSAQPEGVRSRRPRRRVPGGSRGAESSGGAAAPGVLWTQVSHPGRPRSLGHRPCGMRESSGELSGKEGDGSRRAGVLLHPT